MDKYIDDFCEEYFSEFEQQGIKCCTDALFDNPRMRPFLFVRNLLGVAIIIIIASYILPLEMSYESNILNDIGIGILSSTLVSLYFIKREKSIQYYEEIVEIIKQRIRFGKKAFYKANEHVRNISKFEGLQLLQQTVRNLFAVLCYFKDKLPNMLAPCLIEDIVIVQDIEENMSDDEMQQHIQNARRTIVELLKRLDLVKTLVRKSLRE